MDEAPRNPARFSRRLATIAVTFVGIGLSILLFHDSRSRENERTAAELVRRAYTRHALTREVLGRYEDALFALNTLLMQERGLTRDEFARAARRIEERIPGALAYEWVPLVLDEQRAAVETSLQRSYHPRSFEFTERSSDGRLIRAEQRPVYFPIAFVEPVAGNERAIGYDLMTGPTRGELELARDARQLTLTRPIRLVQEDAPNQMGVILISPVWRPANSALPDEPATFAGFVQTVFRVQDLLERTRATPADSALDMLFVDGAENDPALRVLCYLPALALSSGQSAPTETEFRRELCIEHSVPLGGRNWRVLYRPRAGWREEQFTPLAWVRAAGVLALTALLAGLVHVLGRRTEAVETVVIERTAQLAESRREITSLLHSLPGMAFRCRYDEHLTVLFVSDGSFALTGLLATDLISGRVHFRDFVHADDLQRVRAATITALEERRDFEVEFRIRLPDGAEKWVLSRGAGIYEADGQLRSFEGLAIDITAQKSAEHERIALERKLLEGQKLESLGLLAGGIAHDFNNLLTGILGNASLTRIMLAKAAPVDAHLRAIETASLRAAELCRQMLAYAGKGRFVVEPVDLSELAAGLVPLLDVSIARKATLRLAVAPVLPRVLADATQLRQIVMNLVLNAADATGDRGGEIVLTTGVMHANHEILKGCATGDSLAEGDYVFLEVRDRGCGMSPEVIAKIFDPFFTTKFAGRGLGLAAALGIVRGHHGALQVTSKPGLGSTFRLLLAPLPSDRASSLSIPPPTSRPAWQSPGHVLVIDDEEQVRQVASSLLATFDLTPSIAVDGAAGLAAFRANPKSFRLVLLDVIMPGLSGEETLLSLRRIRSDVPVLLMSGYNEGDLLRRLASPGSRLAFLPKPFTLESLESKLRELLG